MKSKLRPSNKYKKEITLALASVILLVLNKLLVLFSKANPEMIEEVYSRKIYRIYVLIISSISGVFGFSVGEIVFILLFIILVYLLVVVFNNLISGLFKESLATLLIMILIIVANVFYFQISWGLNNYRLNAAALFELSEDEITVEELKKVYLKVIIEANALRESIVLEKTENPYSVLTLEDIYNSAYEGYHGLHENYDFINDDKVIVKPLFISPVLSSTGYTGIYLYILGEPTVNNMPPLHTIPFTACHEIAHQKGFASEDEANFVGFLACLNHREIMFQYSGYLGIMGYLGSALYQSDLASYNEISAQRSDLVLLDLSENEGFWDTYINKTNEELHTKANDVFLKANNQPEGVLNYSKVTELIIKWYRNQ